MPDTPASPFPVLNRADAPELVLDDHHAFDGRQLHGPDDGIAFLSCEFAPGGHAEEHVHDDTTLLIVVIDGELHVDGGGAPLTRVGPQQSVRIEAGVPHRVTNASPSVTRYVAVSFPSPDVPRR